MRKLFIALLATASLSAAVSTASASTTRSLITGFDAVHQTGWQHAFDVADCSGGSCKYEEPQDPLASPEDGKRSSSPDALQDCQGGCGSAKPEARSVSVADCNGGGCKYEEPQTPLASPDALQDCQGGCGSAKPEARSVSVADCSGGGCKYEEPQDPLASPEDGKRGTSPDALQDCQGQCAKSETRRLSGALLTQGPSGIA